MKVKRYKDGTLNIFYDVGDMVKVVDNDKYSSKKTENEGLWGEVTKIKGKPVTAKLTIDTKSGEIEEFVWNVIPVDEMGNEIPKDELSEFQSVKESRRIKRFNEF